MIAAFLLWANCAHCEIGPRNVLNDVLNGDFIADNEARFKFVEYTNPADSKYPLAPQTLLLDREPIVVIKGFEIVDERAAGADMKAFKVKFLACGVSRITNDSRRLETFAPASEGFAEYWVARRAEDWKLIDPPVAMIGRNALLADLQRRVDRVSQEAAETLLRTTHISKTEQSRMLDNFKRIRAELQPQIDTLLSMRCQ